MKANADIQSASAVECAEQQEKAHSIPQLLAGQLPFEGADKPAIKAAILRGNMKPLPANLKPECVSFMSLMLARDPRDRASAHELLQHPFIRMYAVPARAHSGSLPTSKPSMSRGGSRETTVAELKGVNRKSSSNASQGATAQTLPLSFSLRHNELADPTIPERMVLKVEACSHDSTDSLIRAQHAALLEYGDAMSSSNSMTCPTPSQSQDSPRNLSSLARGKSKSPLQLETRSWSASQMRSMNANRRVEEIASPNFLKKVAVIFKSMLTKPTLDNEASAAAS
ncbi:TPA: Serine/threonine-protein kinase [Trebouxia sp. C0004]